MNWLLISLIPPASWAVANNVDKHLVSRYFKKTPTAVLMISASVALIILPIMALINPAALSIDPQTALLITLNGSLFFFCGLPYYQAIKLADVTVIAALWQLAPVFTYVLGFLFLNENLSLPQIIASLIIISGSLLISLDLDHPKFKLKTKPFFLMILANLIYSTNVVIFKRFALDVSYKTALFWEQVGFVCFGLFMLIFVKSHRLAFFRLLKPNKLKVYGFGFFGESFSILAKIVLNYAILLVPATLVLVINATQPLFVLIYALLLAFLIPKLSHETFTKKNLLQKIFSIFIIFIGIYLLNN